MKKVLFLLIDVDRFNEGSDGEWENGPEEVVVCAYADKEAADAARLALMTEKANATKVNPRCHPYFSTVEAYERYVYVVERELLT